MKLGKLISSIAITAAVFASVANPVNAAVTTVKVLPEDMATSFVDLVENPTAWFYYNDENNTIGNTLGNFVTGPQVPPAGSASVQISVSGTQRRNLATYQFAGVALADISTLAYSTYNPSVGNGGGSSRSGYLQFNVDFDGSDTWQRRLVYLPADNGTVVPDQWQEWSNSPSSLWRYSGPTWPGTPISGTTPRTWADILASYPGVRVRVTDSFLGIRVGEPYANGYTENLDAIKFGINGNTTVFDFEIALVLPTAKDQCKNGGWMTFTDVVFKNQGQCVSYVANMK